MFYAPNLKDYRPFYIQTPGDEAAVDTRVWGMIAKTHPVPILPNPKDPYKNDWKDKNGDDEYTDELWYKAEEMKVDFFIKTFDTPTASAEYYLNYYLQQFFDKVKAGEFMVYAGATGIGFSKVRYGGYAEQSKTIDASSMTLIFTISFKVNDPLSRVTPNDGELVIIEGDYPIPDITYQDMTRSEVTELVNSIII